MSKAFSFSRIMSADVPMRLEFKIKNVSNEGVGVRQLNRYQDFCEAASNEALKNSSDCTCSGVGAPSTRLKGRKSPSRYN